MRNLIWFCIGIVTGRLAIPLAWHVAYLVIIAILLLNTTGWHLVTIR